ncbi:MAG TPA: glycosyltransferase, partial [Chthoniobacterales bacterium]|nr:glycosyltransferase [Chthoniobacterales bacterium]
MTHFSDLTLATTTHNNYQMLAEMLTSFETSLGTVDKVIIVDDGSRRASALPPVSSGVRLIRNELAHGSCQASDMALRAVRTRFALLVDADVFFEPGDFAGGFAEFQRGNWAWVNCKETDLQGQAQLGYHQRLMPPWVFAAGNQASRLWEKFQPALIQTTGQRIVEVEAAHASCTLVNLEAFRAVDGFDHWYWQSQSDFDLSLRLRKAGWRVGIDLGYAVKHEGTGG